MDMTPLLGPPARICVTSLPPYFKSSGTPPGWFETNPVISYTLRWFKDTQQSSFWLCLESSSLENVLNIPFKTVRHTC